MPEITVDELILADAGDWSFRDSTLRYNYPGYGHLGTFDPFPAYAHNLAEADRAARHVAECCPPLWDVHILAADREETGRTNGYSLVHARQHYADGAWVQDEPLGLVVMAGKRIPPHPAMTRYLVAHEYGHHVCWMIGHARGASHLQDESWLEDFAAARGLPGDLVRHGSGGTWHRALAEIFACDFRIAVCHIEDGYWPHPGIAHPTSVDMGDWWERTLFQLDQARP
jgi:hypothetical protein